MIFDANFYYVIDKIETHGGLGMRADKGTCRMLYALAIAMKPSIYVDDGTFVGLSCLWVAKAMEEIGHGKIYTVEIDKHWLDMAKSFAMEAKLDHRIEFILGNSADVLPMLPDEIDLALIDIGDKNRYIPDFEILEPKLTKNAIIVAHDIIHPSLVDFETAWHFKEYINQRSEFYNSFWINAEYGTLLVHPVR